MDLYLIGSKYVGTQADARREAKAQGVRFDPATHSVRVPTDKAGLIAFLNERQTPAPIPSVATPTPAAEGPYSAVRVLCDMDVQAARNALKEARQAIDHGLSLMARRSGPPAEQAA